MKTVLTDNSLCTFPLAPNVKPEYIYKYIKALAETGIQYVELDFRTMMKVTELPDGIKYIFRITDPMFTELTNVFDFSYALVTLADLKQRVKVNTPIIMELSAIQELSPQMLSFLQERIDGPITMARLRGNFSFDSFENASRFVRRAKNNVPIAIDVCPMNKYKRALDSAIKLHKGNADSLTMCMGMPRNYASIEEFLFTLLSVHQVMLKDISMTGLCKAAVYHQIVFGGYSGDSIANIMQILDADVMGLRNVDTGKRAPVSIMLKEKALLKKNYISALENFINNEDIPEDFAYDIYEAIKRYDTPVYSEELMTGFQKGIMQ